MEKQKSFWYKFWRGVVIDLIGTLAVLYMLKVPITEDSIGVAFLVSLGVAGIASQYFD